MKTFVVMITVFTASLGSLTATAADRGGFIIKNFLSSGPEANLVSLQAGHQTGLKSGEIFRVVRPSRAGVDFPVETGLLKVLTVHEHEAVAQVLRQGTPESEALFNGFGGVMAGDLAVAQRLSIAPAKSVVPEITVKYSSIFDDPNAAPVTYELTVGGRRELAEIAQRLGGVRSGMLLVEGHTDAQGTSSENQMESYQRALTIRQILINQYGFDADRITALGLGESQPVSETLTPGNSDRSRRIVFRVVAMPHVL
jgi:hypothetical protein